MLRTFDPTLMKVYSDEGLLSFCSEISLADVQSISFRFEGNLVPVDRLIIWPMMETGDSMRLNSTKLSEVQ